MEVLYCHYLFFYRRKIEESDKARLWSRERISANFRPKSFVEDLFSRAEKEVTR